MKRPGFFVAVLLTVHAGLLAWSAYCHSPTIDEVGHLVSGLSHWELGRFNLYCVNPPLVRLVAALPVLPAKPHTDWSKANQDPHARAEFDIGREFIAANGPSSFWYFRWARWACIPFSLLGGYICFRWARELYGLWAGYLALVLWCFCPNILAFASLITPDAGAAALGLTAAYFFWLWLKNPGWSGAFFAGLFLGLAELTKMTWVVLFPLWPLLWLVYRWPFSGLSLKARVRETGQLVLVLSLGLYLLNLGYGFDHTFARLGNFQFVSRTLQGQPMPNRQGQSASNRFAETWLGSLPVPVPKYYLLGIDQQKRDFEMKWPSYLRGEWRKRGWWYYYLYGLLIKVPLGTWLLVFLALIFSMKKNRLPPGEAASLAAPTWRDELVLLAPAVVVLTLVSSQTGFNHHLRYVLPIFPFVYVWLGKVAAAAVWLGWKFRSLCLGALTWAVAASLFVYPHNMSYFNELAGGPSGGHNHLVDSNIDWGQDLLYLKEWLDEHPEARPLGLAYFGGFDPRVLGIEFTLPAKGPPIAWDFGHPQAQKSGLKPGWYAVSVSLLRGLTFSIANGQGGWEYTGEHDAYTYFLHLRPVARAGYSIFIFHVTPEEAERLRRGWD